MKTIWSAAHTDVGIKKNKNQDAVMLKVAASAHGKLVFAVVCDGVGGLQQGERASMMLCENYGRWFTTQLPDLLEKGLTRDSFEKSLGLVTYHADEQMKKYGKSMEYEGLYDWLREGK